MIILLLIILLCTPITSWAQEPSATAAALPDAATQKLTNQILYLQRQLANSKLVIERLEQQNAKMDKQLFDLVSSDFQPVAKGVLEKRFETQKEKLEDDIADLKHTNTNLQKELDEKNKKITRLQKELEAVKPH